MPHQQFCEEKAHLELAVVAGSECVQLLLHQQVLRAVAREDKAQLHIRRETVKRCTNSEAVKSCNMQEAT